MIAILYLLALISVITLVDQALTQPYSPCTSARWGTKDGKPVEIPTVYFNPNIQSWKVDLKIEDAPNCNGVEVTVCDVDKAPNSVRFLAESLMKVDRTGNLQGVATLNGVAYCNCKPKTVQMPVKTVIETKYK